MTRFRKTIAIVLALAMSLALITSQTKAAKKTKLNKSKLILYIGNSYSLKLKNNKNKVKWSSSKTKIASVSSTGKVKAKKRGNCKIIAKVGKKKYICKVTVKKKSYKPNSHTEDLPTITPSSTNTPIATPFSTSTPTAITDDTFSGRIFAAYAWILLEEYMSKRGDSSYTVTTISSATSTDKVYKDCIQIEGISQNKHYYFIAGLRYGEPTIGSYFTSMKVRGVNSYYLSAIMFSGLANYNLNGEFSTTGIVYDYYDIKSLKNQFKAEGNYQMY